MKFIFFILFSLSYVFCGCSSRVERMIRNNIAEIRNFVVYGKNEKLSASLMCGLREQEYKMNGYATNLIEFGVITINLIDKNLSTDKANFILFVGTEKFEGDLVINPFDESLVADIKVIVNSNANISLKLCFDVHLESLKLKKIETDWIINTDDCVSILVDKYSDKLKKLIRNNQFDAEVYIKIMNDENKLVSDFYFLISVVGRKGEYINIIVSPQTAEILASNNNL